MRIVGGRVMADLRTGWEIWLQYAFDIGAITLSEQAQLQRRVGKALVEELAAMQVCHHQASDPALRFLSLFQLALAGGQAHVADRLGRVPDSPRALGLAQNPPQVGLSGTRIGWAKENDLFLDPAVSYQMAQRMAGAERVSIGAQTPAIGCGSMVCWLASTLAVRWCSCGER